MPKPIPAKLGQKLKTIRRRLNYTQDQMAGALGRRDTSRRARVHEWETGKRQPDLPSLLAYARLAGVYCDVLIDDEQELALSNREKV